MNETKQPICDALLTKCKSCSGIMQYSPSDEDLKCVYCGNIAELDMANCVAYRKEFLAGFITEIYQIDFRNGVQKAKEKMDSYE